MIRLASLIVLCTQGLLGAGEPRDDIAAALDRGDCAAAFAVLDRDGSRLTELDRAVLEGRTEMCARRWHAARTALQTAVRLNPDDPAIRLSLGQVHAELRSDLLAIEQFEKAAWLGLDTVELNLAWARCALRSGHARGRTTLVDLPAGSRPGDLLSDGVLIRLAARAPKGVVADAGSALYRVRKALERRPGDAEALIMYGDAWTVVGEPQMASKAYQQAMAVVAPARRGEILDKLASVLLDLGEFEAYFARLRERMQIDGGLDRARLATAYEKAAQTVAEHGDLDRQIRYLRFAVEIEATADRHIALADAELLAGRTGDAVDHWQAALDTAPTHPARAALEERIRQYGTTGDTVTK